MTLQGSASAVLLAAGCFFVITGGLGVLRMPDFYSRLHPAAKGDTLGQVLVLGGVAVHLGAEWACLKLLLVAGFLLLTSPTATHAVARAAHLAGSDAEPEA